MSVAELAVGGVAERRQRLSLLGLELMLWGFVMQAGVPVQQVVQAVAQRG